VRATITDWHPEDEDFWQTTGRRVARRNLIWSVFAEFLGFSVWQLWSVTAVKLNDAGFDLTTGQLFWLVAIPGLVGATMRFPYTFAPARFGGRNWTVASALLLLIPSIGLAVGVSDPSTPYWALLALAGTAGFGGGNFSSSMANISHFYPDRHKGAALGLNAAGGNIGVAVAQKLVPWAVGGGLLGGALLGGSTGSGTLFLQNAGLVYVPLIVLAAVCAWRFMDNLPGARSTFRDQAVAIRRSYAWTITWLYIGAFGSFIGFSAALPLLIKTQFTGVDPLDYAFLGPLVGSLSRPFGGWLADRAGGARITLVSFAAMAVAVIGALQFLHAGAFGGFLAMFMLLFVFSGMANGSVFKMVPTLALHDARARLGGGGDDHEREVELVARREGAAVIGLSAAIAAYGAFLIPEGLKRSLNATGTIDAALYVFLGFYVSCMTLTWWRFLRRSFAARRQASLAHLGV
jgi:NNP family nitrate/nitrite transporter-like MFS transporter